MSLAPYTTDNMYFAALLLYVFGFENLLRTHLDEYGAATFTVDAADVDIYLEDYEAGQASIASLKHYVEIVGRLYGVVRKLKRSGERDQVSRAWINGRG